MAAQLALSRRRAVVAGNLVPTRPILCAWQCVEEVTRDADAVDIDPLPHGGHGWDDPALRREPQVVTGDGSAINGMTPPTAEGSQGGMDISPAGPALPPCPADRGDISMGWTACVTSLPQCFRNAPGIALVLQLRIA